ncbi:MULTISPECIES: hypothetical protein [Nocardia]|uniref:hypothetical protein n=1 Tax=Nocardia TaxID=1817 RepID=UPI002454F74F|nr:MULTISPECIES: hypothetical protein [Nocardia]
MWAWSRTVAEYAAAAALTRRRVVEGAEPKYGEAADAEWSADPDTDSSFDMK